MWNFKGVKMKNIIVEKRNRIGIVTVNRPNELNSMNSETRKELAIAFEELDLDDDVNVSILTGSPGKAFIAGADIKEFSKKFDLDFIVTGGIRASGKRVRISIELSDAKDDSICLLYTSPSPRDRG